MLILLALLLLAAGADAGAASIGVFGNFTRHSTLFANPTGKFIGSAGDWLWPVAAVTALVIVLLAARWLLALLFSTDRSPNLPLPTSEGAAGRTILTSGALTRAVTEEIRTYPGIDAARARIIGDADDPELVVTVTLKQSADLAALRQRIEAGAITHARLSIGNPAMPAQLDLTVTSRRPARVV
ncbi:MAG: alkaline shock response membrane anchor protein AmaP [Actinomycetota bacterium]